MTEKPTYRELEKKIQKLERSQSEIKRCEIDFEKELRLRTILLDNIPDCIALILKKESRQIVASNKFAKELGAVPGRTCFSTCAMRDSICPWCLAPKLWETGQQQRIETEYKGEWYKKIWAPLTDDLYIHYIFNITERKRIEESLSNSEHKLNTHIQNTPVGALCLDLNFTIIEWNPAAQAIFAYSEAEALGQNVFELIVPENVKEMVNGIFQDLLSENGNVSSTNENMTRDGRRIMCDWYNTVLKDADGKVIGIAALVHDVTERKNTEKKLKENQERYKALSKMLRLMCDNVPDMIWAKDLDKRFIFTNKAICQKLLNTDDTDEPIGKTDLFFAGRERSHHPNNRNWHTFGELCQDSDEITMEKGSPQQFDEFGNVKGGYLFLDVYKAPFIDETGKMVGTVGSARDVTSAKETESKLKQLNEELEKRIKERTSSLEDVNTALRVLLKKREEDKNQIGENIYASFKSLIQPLISQLKNSLTLNSQEDILDILESSIKEMATPFSRKLADPILGLTPTETQVAALVKDGKTNKEITQILNKSIRAISSHRDNIRQKLGLKNKKINLRSYLLSLD